MYAYIFGGDRFQTSKDPEVLICLHTYIYVCTCVWRGAHSYEGNVCARTYVHM